MFVIINKFYKNSKSALFQDILDFYDKNWYVIVNYLYGANMVKQDLSGEGSIVKTNTWSYNFKQILIDSDFLLPDGAAIRTMRKVWKLFWRFDWPPMMPNLNGTDFLPYFIDRLISSVWLDRVFIHYLTVYDYKVWNEKWHLLHACKSYIQKRFWLHLDHINWYEIEYSDKNYKDRSWWGSISSKSYDHWSYHLFLNFRGTPHQEIRSYLNKDFIKKNRLLVFDQWGTVDFRVGKESRAPLIIRKLRLESIWRLVQYPQKNWKKFIISFKMIWLIIKKIIFIHK